VIRWGVCFLLLCLLVVASQGQHSRVSGSWRQSGIKWTKAPTELHLKQRYAESAVLYFGASHDFALVYASVIQGPRSEVLSRGDGQVVYLGTWRPDGPTLHLEYQLISRTVSKSGETLPGPRQKGDVQIKNGTLLFEKMGFQRDPRLDDDLRAILQGERARFSAAQ